MTEELKKTASNTARELRVTLGTRGLELRDDGNIRWSKTKCSSKELETRAQSI